MTSTRGAGPGRILSDRLASGTVELMPGVWDALSARLAAEAGFSTLFVSGFAVSAARLGAPDVGLLTQSEMADVARSICRVVGDRSVVVDADTGYGDVVNVRRTVESWEQAGAAGMFLEDQVWPKRCGHMAGKQVVDAGEWSAKIAAAVATRTHLHVTARTDARAVLGLEAAIERGRMARDAGADAVFVEAPETIDELARIADALGDVTLVANMVERGRTPLLTPAELTDLGFRLIVSPVSLIFSIVPALRRTLSTLSTAGTLRDDLDQLVGFDEFTQLVGLDEITAWRAQFTGSAGTHVRDRGGRDI